MDEAEWRPDDALAKAVEFVFVGHLVGIKPDDRQRAIQRLEPGERVQVVRDYTNAYRQDSCLVLNMRGERLGIVPDERAVEIACSIDAGDPWCGYVGRIFYDHRATYGGGLEVTIGAGGASSNTPIRYGVDVWLGRPHKPAPTPADWYPDPTERHEWRYWDGASWTAQVSDEGTTSTDPIR